MSKTAAMMQRESALTRYNILHPLGRGALGAVYAARDEVTGAVVALKTLDPLLLERSDANFADRFLKHAHSAQLLQHGNIVRIHDAGEAAGTAYIAMEMLEGESLRKILDRGPLPIARAIRIAHEVASGLAHAHLEGVVHGSLKPSNIIVLRSGAVKITDFGIGQLGQAQAGSLGYLSPEQLRGEPVDHRCDLFSLGALFYEMLTHRLPFEGGSPHEMMENMLRAEPPLPSELNQHVPRVLDGIVLSMLAAQPAVRMPGAPILLRDLQRLEEELGLGPATKAGTDAPAASAPPAGSAADELQHRNRITDGEAFDYHRAMAMMERRFGPERSAGSRPAIFAGLALVLAVLAIGLAGFLYYSPDSSERGVAASGTQQAPAPAPAVTEPSAPPPLAEVTKEVAAEPKPEPAPAPEKPVPAAAAPAQEPPQAAQSAEEKVPDEEPGGTARLIVAVSPRGEIYIDGKHHGTTPPMTTFDLEPGMHRIEVRSGSRKPYLTYMTVEAGDVRRIRHDFNARPGRPPG